MLSGPNPVEQRLMKHPHTYVTRQAHMSRALARLCHPFGLRVGVSLAMVWGLGVLAGCEGLPIAYDEVGAPEALGDRDHDGWADCPAVQTSPDLTCDCDDTNPNKNPGLAERCDAIDNDCDGRVPADELDQDQDGFTGCGEGDCDDLNAKIYRDAPEQCDGLDDNCDGTIPTDEQDSDQDGLSPCEGDCQDTSPDVLTAPRWYEDRDGDGFGNPNSPFNACVQPSGFVSNTLDCDDARAEVNPHALELCDSIDQDCNGDPRNYFDGDHDGFGRVSDGPCQNGYGWIGQGGDCDDTDASVYPTAPEDPSGDGSGDGKDNDCNGESDEGTSRYDGDRDGVTVLEGDCNDQHRYIHPQAAEVCDALDNDCDSLIDEDSEQGTGCVWFVSLNPGNSSSEQDGLTWESAFTSFAALTPHLKEGQEVWVARGSYRAAEPHEAVLIMVAGVRYRGGFIGNETVLAARPTPYSGTLLDGDTDLSGLHDTSLTSSAGDANPVVVGARDALLEGFTIQNGVATLSSGHREGGGVRMVESGRLALESCTVLSNHAEGSGAGLYLGTDAVLSLKNSRFIGNVALESGSSRLARKCRTAGADRLHPESSGHGRRHLFTTSDAHASERRLCTKSSPCRKRGSTCLRSHVAG